MAAGAGRGQINGAVFMDGSRVVGKPEVISGLRLGCYTLRIAEPRATAV